MIWLLMALACGAPDQASPKATPPSSPEELAAVADQIVASPAEADRILSDAGLDRRSFEVRLYRIAEDAEASRAFNAARRR